MVKLDIRDETSPLTDLCVCRGSAVPPCEGFVGEHPEYDTFRMLPWDREKLVAQQDRFHDVLDRHGVRLHFVPHSDTHPWQMYTRDTGFVVGGTLYYAPARELLEREGEIDLVRAMLPDVPAVEIEGQIEGGDVMPDGDVVFVGLTTRTTRAAAEALGRHVEVVPLWLGPEVMHLDTRMTILPGRRLLAFPGAFLAQDLEMLRRRFRLIEATEAEARAMGTNVFVIDPETVVVHAGHERIARVIEAEGLRAERVDWSEPNALLGSFRCATMPLARAA